MFIIQPVQKSNIVTTSLRVKIMNTSANFGEKVMPNHMFSERNDPNERIEYTENDEDNGAESAEVAICSSCGLLCLCLACDLTVCNSYICLGICYDKLTKDRKFPRFVCDNHCNFVLLGRESPTRKAKRRQAEQQNKLTKKEKKSKTNALLMQEKLQTN